MQRILTDHKVGTLNEKIQVMSTDPPGVGGAHHDYIVELSDGSGYTVRFHDGKSKDINAEEDTINGMSHEALLTIIADRLKCFQTGEFACSQNAEALSHVEAALAALHARTNDRIARSVHGTLEK